MICGDHTRVTCDSNSRMQFGFNLWGCKWCTVCPHHSKTGIVLCGTWVLSGLEVVHFVYSLQGLKAGFPSLSAAFGGVGQWQTTNISEA